MSESINCKDCNGHAVVEKEIEGLKKEITNTINKMDSFDIRLKAMELSSAKTEVKLDNIYDMLMQVKSSIEEYGNKPGKRWDAATLVIITAIITGTISMFFTKFIK